MGFWGNAYLIYDNSHHENFHKNAKFLIDSRSQRVYEMNLLSIYHLGSNQTQVFKSSYDTETA